MIKPTKPQVQRTHEEIFAENMKRFESTKNASELSSAFGYVSICGVWKSFVTEEDKKAYAQAYMDAYNRIKARYESSDWEWKLVVPEIVKAFFAQEETVAEKDFSGKAVLTLPQIAKLEKMGFSRWTKDENDRLYIKAWNVNGIKTNWNKRGKKTITMNGEELSYTKSAAVSYASIYIDVKSGELVVECEDAFYGNQIRELVEKMTVPALKKEVRTEQNSISAGTFAKAMKISLSQTRKIAVLCGVAKTAIWKATKTLYSTEEERKMFAYYSSAIRSLKAKSGKVSVKEIASALCLSVSTVYRRIKARGVKLERGINANDIDKLF